MLMEIEERVSLQAHTESKQPMLPSHYISCHHNELGRGQARLSLVFPSGHNLIPLTNDGMTS